MKMQIEITATAQKVMEIICADTKEHVQNFINERARIGGIEIVTAFNAKAMETGEPLAASVDDAIDRGIEKGWIQTAAEKNRLAAVAAAEFEAHQEKLREMAADVISRAKARVETSTEADPQHDQKQG